MATMTPLFKVRGQVRDPGGRPIADAPVRIFNKGLRADVLLGETKTNPNGNFEFECPGEGLSLEARTRPSLILRALDRHGEILASSVIYPSDPVDAVVLTAGGTYRGPAEFDELLATIAPRLKDAEGRKIFPQNLSEEDINFLAGDTGGDRQRLAWLVQADKSSQATAGANPVPASVFYACIRQGLPEELPELLKYDLATLRSALEVSPRDRIISPLSPGQLDEIMSAIAGLKAEHALEEAPAAVPASLGDLLRGAVEDEGKRKKIALAWARAGQADEAFWKDAEESANLRESELKRMRAALEFGNLTGGHLPLVRELEARSQDDQTLKDPKNFSKLNKEDWKDLLKTVADRGEEAFPSGTPGLDPEEKIDAYAEVLRDNFEAKFPSETLAYRIEGDVDGPFTDKSRGLLTKFLGENPNFKLRAESLDRYFEKNPNAALPNADDQALLRKDAQKIQRLIKLTERYEHIRELLKKKIHSAQGIVLYGKRDFVDAYAAIFGGKETAGKIYDKAEGVHSVAMNVYAKHSRTHNSPLPYVIRGDAGAAAYASTAEWRELFGSLDLCECAHCQSVYSPAAYFADLLKFLSEAPPLNGETPLQILLKRRPEMEHIELSCENANTLLPYIDLVNEVLEDAVAPPAAPIWRQTKASESELAANPEHVNEAAYRTLANGVYPWILPFNLPWEESRVYLTHLGIPLWRLHEITFPESATASSLADSAIAREYLGLSVSEAGIVNGTIVRRPGGVITLGAPADRPWDFWGMLNAINAIPDPLNPLVPILGTWDFLLQRVDFFLQKSGLNYQELLGLLDTYFVNPALTAGGRTLSLVSASNDPAEAATCDPAKLRINGLSIPTLTRIHRFVRLWRKLGWSMRDLDRAIAALSPGNISDAFLIQLSHLERLREALRLPVVKLLGFWAKLDTADYPGERAQGRTEASLYEQLFLNPAVLNPPDTSFALNAARNELANPFNPALAPDPSRTILGHAPAIAAALKLNAEELALLVSGDSLSALPGAVADELTLANLSKLFRYAALAQSLKLSIRELLTLIALSGVEPFTAVPATVGAPARTATENTVWFVRQIENLRASGVSVAELDYLLRHREAPGLVLAPGADEIKLFLTSLHDSLGKTSNLQGEVIQAFSEGLNLEMSVAGRLLMNVWAVGAGNSLRLVDPFLATAFLQATPGPAMNLEQAPFQAAADAYRRMHKLAFLIAKFELKPDELKAAFNLDGATAGFNPYALPFRPQTGGARFADWLRFTELMALRETFPGGGEALAEVFQMAANPGVAETAYLSAVSERLSWSLDDLQDLAQGFALNFPEDYQDGRTLAKLLTCFRAMKRLGGSATQLLAWGKRNPTAAELGDNARAIKRAAKAKYDETEWLRLARPLRNALRERQRQALVAYLLAIPKTNPAGIPLWKDPSGMSEHFLIDVEMSPCALTSRIKQATLSVQMLVQRALMNLEPEIDLGTDAAREWNQFRKQYRVFEANRKIFLYPENWIEPELRDDKTPLFEELENELMQNDVTRENAEAAIQHYVEGLRQIAHLEPAGLYVEKELGHDNGPITAHVFARQASSPKGIYYRRLTKRDERDPGVWSPWGKVEVDVEGDHLLPIVWEGRLFLFWPEITEVPEPEKEKETDDSAAAAAPQMPKKYWQVQFAWSRYQKGVWSPKNLLRESLLHPVLPKKTASRTLTFRGRGAGEEILIQCFGAEELPKAAPKTIERGNQPLDAPGPRIQVKGFVYDYDDGNKGIAGIGLALRSLTTKLKSVPVASGVAGGTINVNVQVPEFEYTTMTNADGSYLFDNIVATNYKLSWSVGTVGGAIIYKTGNPASPYNGETQINGSQGRIYHRDIPFYHTDAWKAPPVPPIDPDRPVMWRAIGDFRLSDGDRPSLVPGPGPLNLVIFYDTLVEGMGYREGAQRSTDNLYLSPANTFPILSTTPGRFRLLTTGQTDFSGGWLPIFFQDKKKTYVFRSRPQADGSFDGIGGTAFFHPYIRSYLRELERRGTDGLFTSAQQRLTDNGTSFAAYLPVRASVPAAGDAVEEVEFSASAPYAPYNWELFFHAPFLIAVKLGRNQRFAEAQRWFHYIFDPTSTEARQGPSSTGAERFWKFKPFYDYATSGPQTLQDLLAETQELEAQIEEWKRHPFQPHRLARLRVVAYMKAVVMRYIENLIAWADQLFQRETTEAINEAFQLYLLAAHILGEKPPTIPPRAIPKPQTYADLQAKLSDLSNAWVEIENFIFPSASAPGSTGNGTGSLGTMPFFCIPKNDKLLGYWNTIAKHLFNIRNCRNIEGRERQLPLYEPEIEPGLLVRAAAAGVDLDSVLSDLSAPLSPYRFSVMLEKANGLALAVQGLGTSLLAAMEKRDAERLALIRAGQEIELTKRIIQMKEDAVREAGENRAALLRSRETAAARYLYFQRLLGNTEARLPPIGETVPEQNYPPSLEFAEVGGARLSSHEKQSLNDLTNANGLLVGAGVMDTIAGLLNLIPNISAITVPPPAFAGQATQYGGMNVGPALSAAATALRTAATHFEYQSKKAERMGGFLMRESDWALQSNLAGREIMQIDRQILAAEIREEISKKDLEHQRKTAEDAETVETFLQAKFSNDRLYDWMVAQTAGVYFQSYQLAYQAAKRAERAYRHELGLADSAFIQFGYWDGLKKGLLAGEKLQLDLRRLEASYLDLNKREYEIAKHVSLALTDPEALVALKANGFCEFELPEALFDKDYPGHYLRRLKSAAVTIPCVTGPFTGVNCTLTLLSHRTRVSDAAPAGGVPYPWTGPGDARFLENYTAIQSVVTSGAQNDSGLFETNLRDERYLPFEGAGAVGRWRLEMPLDCNAFDFSTVSDLILHLRYTAREASSPNLKTQAQATIPATGLRLFDLKREFPTEWHQMFHPAAGADQTLTLPLTDARFPFHQPEQSVRLTRMEILARIKGGGDFVAQLISPTPVPPATTPPSSTYNVDVDAPTSGRLYRAGANLTNVGLGSWRLKLRRDTAANFRQLRADQVLELFLLCRFDLA